MADHYDSRENMIALLSAEIRRALDVSPNILGREVYVPLSALLTIRGHLQDDREWFWRIVDEDGPPGLPSDEELALQLMLEAWKRTPA